MGEWEKIHYRNAKRNCEALITIGNRKFWVPVSLGNMKQVFSLHATWPSLRWLHLLTVSFCVETNLEEIFVLFFFINVGLALAVHSSPLALF